jgi:hypothetical protein
MRRHWSDSGSDLPDAAGVTAHRGADLGGEPAVRDIGLLESAPPYGVPSW